MFFDMYGSKEMAEEKRKKMDMFKQIAVILSKHNIS